MWGLKDWPTRWLTRYQGQKARLFDQKLRDLKAEGLHHTLSDTLAQAKVKTLAAKKGDVKGEGINNLLADTDVE